MHAPLYHTTRYSFHGRTESLLPVSEEKITSWAMFKVYAPSTIMYLFIGGLCTWVILSLYLFDAASLPVNIP